MKALLPRKSRMVRMIVSFLILLVAGLSVELAFFFFAHESLRSVRQIIITSVIFGAAMGWAGPWADNLEKKWRARRAQK